jgi:hypothetical protein
MPELNPRRNTTKRSSFAQVSAALVVMVLGMFDLFYATGIKGASVRAEGEM